MKTDEHRVFTSRDLLRSFLIPRNLLHSVKQFLARVQTFQAVVFLDC